MLDSDDIRENIQAALGGCADGDLRRAAKSLFEALGYKSDRTAPWDLDTFLELSESAQKPLTVKDRETLRQIKSLDLIFQVGDGELSDHGDLFESLDTERIQSYLFFAIDLPAGNYTRADLAIYARLVNKPLPMPAIVLFRHGEKDDPLLSLAILRRRLNKRDASRDVLEKATLIKDIRCIEPIRAHIEILHDFSLPSLREDEDIPNFVRLHAAWEKKLDTKDLSKQFYQEVADWYFWAKHQVEDGNIRLPLHCDTEQENSLFLIRLLTRVIFCWFLVEKRLVPASLFRQKHVQRLLKDFNPSSDSNDRDSAPTYYRAILQNLFFGTLNMPPEQRAFRQKKKKGERYDKNYGITNLWRYESCFRRPSDWTDLAKEVPFLNGGLFDCLDDKSGKKSDNFILDGFSDREDHGCHLGNDVFFGAERSVDLSKDYGEEKKKTARSKRATVRGLVETLSRYKFTIEENTPLEEEIALDPELLGNVFENLLASYNEDTATTARKALGAFYTPREIVNYMVDEAIKNYLTTQVPRCKGALGDLFSNKATLKEINPKTRETLIAAIGRVKILDPACGSGAFPMGALHRLVDLLQKLDPNNESWKRDRLGEARRYRTYLENFDPSEEELAACDTRISEIEKSFDTRFHALDFARKLYLIESCIYGVDIQPIATQIAKLRFFISLVVDQKVDLNAPNLGVRPLPNLETRLVAANSLVPIDKMESDLLTGELDDLRSELSVIRHQHFNARSPADKRRWREADEVKRGEIAALLEANHALPRDTARNLANCDLYDQNESQPFFDSEWMFGLPIGTVNMSGERSSTLLGNFTLVNELQGQAELTSDAPKQLHSGFDIVIGNPPYIRIQTLKRQDPELASFLKKHYASAAKGNFDIYVVFVEAGLKLLKPDGHLAYICPHKFFNTQYGEPLRRLISRGRNLRHVVHFGDEQVFPGATIYTCLLFLTRNPSSECRFIQAHDLGAWIERLAGIEGLFRDSFIGEEEWNFIVGPGRAVFEAIVANGLTLADVAENIFQGLVTSADSVYLLEQTAPPSGGLVPLYSAATEKNYELEEAVVHPLCKGSLDILRWRITSPKRVLFPYDPEESAVTGSSTLISPDRFETEYPHAWEYLLENRDTLENRERGKMKTERWYGYVYPKSVTLFARPKLMTPSIASAGAYAFDEYGEFYFVGSGGGGGGGYGIIQRSSSPFPDWALLGILNSGTADFFIRQTSSRFQGGYYAYNRQFIERLPLPSITSRQAPLVIRTAKILAFLSKPFGDDSIHSPRDPLMLAYWERVLNGLVYELYFEDVLKAADLQIFDLLDNVGLPDLSGVPATGRIAVLRQKFEECHDGAHPLRIALDKLQTLDTVRIIEGEV